MEIKNTKDIRIPTVNAIFYGAIGTGKTTLSASFPKPIIFNIEKGLNSLAGLDVDYIDVTNYKDFQNNYKELVSTKNEYRTLIVDTATELAEWLMLAIAGKEQPRIQDWGELARRFGRMLRELRDNQINTVLLFHENSEEIVTDAGISGFFKRPEIPGKALRGPILRYVDLIGYTSVEVDKNGEESHFVDFRPQSMLIAKSRFETLKKKFEIGEDDGVYQIIEDGINETIQKRMEGEHE